MKWRKNPMTWGKIEENSFFAKSLDWAFFLRGKHRSRRENMKIHE